MFEHPGTFWQYTWNEFPVSYFNWTWNPLFFIIAALVGSTFGLVFFGIMIVVNVILTISTYKLWRERISMHNDYNNLLEQM